MGVLPIIADSTEELTEIFKDLHAHPEIGFTETRTAGVVAEKLRAYGVDAEEALRAANTKFERRFRAMEQLVGIEEFTGLNISEQEDLWQQVKKGEKAG